MRELVLVRHGETVGQSSIRLYGSTDVALAPEGEAQVRAAGRALVGQRFDAVFTSPLRRARRSAEVMLAAIEHPEIEIEVVEAFREIDFGAWEGRTWAEVRERDPEGHARWTQARAGFRFPGGEAREAFIERVQAGVGPSIEARFSAGAARILAVVHKGVIRATAARLLGLPWAELELELPLGALVRLRLDAERWALVPGDPRNTPTAVREPPSTSS